MPTTHVDAFVHRSKRCGFCPTNLPTFDDLLGQADTRLFSEIVANDQHVLHQLLPSQTTSSQNYTLRERPHQFQLPERSGRLSDSNLVNRMLYKDIYTNFLLINDSTCSSIVNRH